MAATSNDPHNFSDLARVLALGVRITRREARGKSTKRLENRVDRIRTQAVQREIDQAKEREEKRKKRK